MGAIATGRRASIERFTRIGGGRGVGGGCGMWSGWGRGANCGWLSGRVVRGTAAVGGRRSVVVVGVIDNVLVSSEANLTIRWAFMRWTRRRWISDQVSHVLFRSLRVNIFSSSVRSVAVRWGLAGM